MEDALPSPSTQPFVLLAEVASHHYLVQQQPSPFHVHRAQLQLLIHATHLPQDIHQTRGKPLQSKTSQNPHHILLPLRVQSLQHEVIVYNLPQANPLLEQVTMTCTIWNTALKSAVGTDIL